MLPPLWAHAYGSTHTDRFWAVCVDSHDDLIVIGETHGSLDLGGDDVFVAKLAP